QPLFKRSLDIFEKALGHDHPDVAGSLNNLAYLYDHQGRYEDAQPLFKRSLDIFEKALGPHHPNVATALNNLAVLYHEQRRYADALPIVRRVIDERKAGPYPTLSILIGAQRANLLSQAQSFADSYNVL